MKSRFLTSGVFTVLAVLVLAGLPDPAPAEVHLNINIGAPPVVAAEPAEIVLIPRIGVYFVPDSGTDLFFYAGFWWAPRGDRWYRSRVCNGSWIQVNRRIVPREVVRIPRDYRVRYRKVNHVPYGQWKKTHYRRENDHGRRGRYDDRRGPNQRVGAGHRHDDR
jgi:hypothetical protein